MDLAFATRELRTVCIENDRARDAHGSAVAEVLRDRLADLRAASSPLELVAGRPGLVDDGVPSVSVALANGMWLVCRVNATIPRMRDGSVDWCRVRRLRVMAIEGGQ